MISDERMASREIVRDAPLAEIDFSNAVKLLTLRAASIIHAIDDET